MRKYTFTSKTSCVYDAFTNAGIPTEEKMKYGITFDEVKEILKNNGYAIYENEQSVNLSDTEGFFIIWDTLNSNKSMSHIEYHIGLDYINQMDLYSIGAIAKKEF